MESWYRIVLTTSDRLLIINKDKVGKVGRAQLEEIAKVKMPDLSAYDIDQAVKIIAGSARSMGIETEGV